VPGGSTRDPGCLATAFTKELNTASVSVTLRLAPTRAGGVLARLFWGPSGGPMSTGRRRGSWGGRKDGGW
jgi:hypothetical protein